MKTSRQITRAFAGFSRVFATALLVLYVNYLPWHLSQACHLPTGFEKPAMQSAACQHEQTCCAHEQGDQNGHHHHHEPHPASEHVLDFVTKAPDGLATITPFLSVTIVPQQPESGLVVASLDPQSIPPPPAQVSTCAGPRAPPVA